MDEIQERIRTLVTEAGILRLQDARGTLFHLKVTPFLIPEGTGSADPGSTEGPWKRASLETLKSAFMDLAMEIASDGRDSFLSSTNAITAETSLHADLRLTKKDLSSLEASLEDNFGVRPDPNLLHHPNITIGLLETHLQELQEYVTFFRCATCKEIVDEEARFCPTCGAELGRPRGMLMETLGGPATR